MNRRIACVLLASAALIVSGCAFIGGSSSGTVSSSDIASYQKVFMSSYYAERGGTPGGAKGLTPFLKVTSGSQSAGAKTTVPVGQLTDNHWATLSPKTLTNYPEPGQTTTFTVTTKDAANSVYDVTATTAFPSDDLRKTYVEEYYVKDITPGNWNAPDGVWTIDDPIVKQSGTWVQDQKARVQQVLTFKDGTTRTETIVAQSKSSDWSGLGNNLYFAVPSGYGSGGGDGMVVSGSLDFSQAFYPVLTTDTSHVLFSSVVIYYVTPSSNLNYWFWQGNQTQTILGIRYYTEYWDTGAQKFNSFAVSFEKTVGTLTTTGGGYSQTLETVFVGSQFSTLAESVLRQQVTYNLDGSGNLVLSTGNKITNMKSRVVDISGQKDFYLTQTSSDYASLSSWATSTIYTPTGNASEIVAANPNAGVFSRTATATVPPLATNGVTDVTGTGDLGILYTSIQEGNGVQGTGSTIPGSIQPAGTEWTYNGAQGTNISDTPTYDLSTKGTVEAWVYLNQQTDTGGIIHKGDLPDFSDECYSLQMWGNQGTVAFVIDPVTATGSGGYYLLTSTTNLNTGKWYYLVAAWDATASTRYVKLYINGTLNASSSSPPSAAAITARTNASGLHVGAQLPTQYNVTYGYFGINGKINGVRISSTPMAAQEVASNYATYLPQTVGW